MICTFINTQKDVESINKMIKEYKSSFIINDTDGKTYENCKNSLDDYKVEIIGFGDDTKGYNPFLAVKDDEDAGMLAYSITENCIADEGLYVRDPFWLNLTTDLTDGLINMACLDNYNIDKSFEGLIDYIDKDPIKDVKSFFKDDKVISALSDTTIGIALHIVQNRLKHLNENFYSKQNKELIDLEKALSEKTAIFVKYPEGMNMNSYVNIIHSQIKAKKDVDFCFFVSHRDHIFKK